MADEEFERQCEAVDRGERLEAGTIRGTLDRVMLTWWRLTGRGPTKCWHCRLPAKGTPWRLRQRVSRPVCAGCAWWLVCVALGHRKPGAP